MRAVAVYLLPPGGAACGGAAEAGTAVAAYWEEDWYRGLVLERRAQGALVRFVDYGNEDEMDDAVLRAATSVERAVPPLALPCRLVGDMAAWRGALEATEYQVSG